MGKTASCSKVHATDSRMKILITGSTGFIGKNLVEFYSKDNLVIETRRGDDITAVLNTHKPDIIINCAAEIYKPELMFESNIVIVQKFLDWLVNNPSTKMIQLGSSAEYGPMPRASHERDRINPVDVYQGTKGAATVMCQGYARQFKLDIQIARVYSAYGKYEKPHRLFSRLYNAFVNQEPMQLYAGYHDFIYIKDFVRGIDTLVKSPVSHGDIINFGSGQQHSNLEVLELWRSVTGSTAPVTYLDTMAKSFESNVWVCDTACATTAYGFTTEYSLEQGIKDLIETMK
jgi:nucleoside-diphosphate-sugar epimerase